MGEQMIKRFLVFQHVPWESPGEHLVRAAKKYGVRFDVIELWHEPIPDITPFDGLIVLGGTPNINQEKEYPFLKEEKKIISQSIKADKPYLGFCLGHQLLADALGARVGPNPCKSVGFIQGRATEKGSHNTIFNGIPQPFPLFKWHSQAVLHPLPEHVEVLATSSECQVEAISVKEKPHLIGLQFDNHAATSANVKRWVEDDREWLSQIPELDVVAILNSAGMLETKIGKQFEVIFLNYIELT